MLTLRNIKPTASILTDIFGYKLLKQEGNRYRFVTDAIENAAIVDLVEEPEVAHGLVAGGTNHHVAFRVKNDAITDAIPAKRSQSKGLQYNTQNRPKLFLLFVFPRTRRGVV